MRFHFHLTEKEEYVLEHVKHILSYVFQILLFLFLLTLLAQQFYPDFINTRININWFMIAVIIFGAISILFPPKQSLKTEAPPDWRDFLLVIALGILGAVIIFLKLKNLGWIGYLISVLGGLIIILLSWLVLAEKDNEKAEEN